MSWVAVAIAGSAVVGAVASDRAADKQVSAARDANDSTMEMFSKTENNLLPYLTAGRTGQANLNYLLGIDTGGETPSSGEIAGNIGLGKGDLLRPFSMADFEASPAYQFNLEEGRKALDKAAAARGRYYAPATLQDIAKYSQGVASNEFQNAFSNFNTSRGNIYARLANLGATGQNAAVQQGGFGQNAANTVGNNLIGAGNAQAAGMVGVANAVGGAANQAYNNYILEQILAKNQTPTYGAPAAGYSAGSIPGFE